MKSLLLAIAPALLAACAVVPPPDATPPAPSGSAVALGEKVRVGDVTVTPVAVVEDSRCPINARCIWAGRLVVRTQIDGQANGEPWRDTADLRLGETFGTHGRVIALVSGEPGKTAEHGDTARGLSLRLRGAIGPYTTTLRVAVAAGG